jgi:hypothetical protein
LTPDSNNGWVWKGEVYKEGAGTNGEWTSTAAADLRKTCDSTRYFWLTAASGQSFRDNASKLTTALRYNAANGVAISFTGGITLFILTPSVTGRLETDGLQFKGPTATGTWLVNATLGTAKISNCIIENAPVRGYTTLINVLAFQNKTESFWLSPDSVSGISFINCTIVGNNANQAFSTRTFDANITVRNCAIFNVTAVAANNASISTANSTYNATNLASFGWTGTGNIVSKTYANQFENTGSGTEDFRVKAGADIARAGIRDQTFTNDLDIVGSARGTGAVGTSTAPTVGAWEFPSITYTYARPTSDITTQWSTSSGTTHYTLIDETVADDNDYIVATAAGQTDEVKLASMTPPQVGTNLVINYKVTGVDGGATVTASLRQGSGGTLIKTDTAKNANNTYQLTVAPGDWSLVTDWSDLRLRFVSA